MITNVDDHITQISKSIIGISGTGISIALNNVSEIVAIIAGVCTALYMFQQWLNSREKGRQLKDDD